VYIQQDLVKGGKNGKLFKLALTEATEELEVSFSKRALYFRERALYSCKTAPYSRKTALYLKYLSSNPPSPKRLKSPRFLPTKEPHILAKEPCIKEPYIIIKEPDIPAKEPYTPAKEPYI